MDLMAAAAALSEAVAALLAADVGAVPEAELLAVVTGVERCRRRLDAVDHVLVAQVESRGVAASRCLPSTAALLRELLTVTPCEAGERVRASADLGPRREVSGAPLEPLYPQTATALAAGDLSSTHARVIRRAVSSLPDVVEKEYGPMVEAVLVEHATTLHPGQLAMLARDVCAVLDPDGSLTDEADRERRRDVTITPRLDGTGTLSGTLTPETMAIWQTVLDALSAPAPAEEGLPDSRSAGQRRHDALRDAAWRPLRSNDLPDTGGAPVALQLTVPAHALTAPQTDADRARPVARTGRGGKLSLFRTDLLTSEAIVLPVGFGIDGGIVSYGRERRLASAAQRRALAARDGGCCFPGCTRPAAWTEVHHIHRYADGGETCLQNLCLVGSFHHREFERRGWQVIMSDGVPHWLPPAWIDPERRPRRNTSHHTPIVFRTP